MTPERAALTVSDHLRRSFGSLLDVRAPERRRRAAGPTWSVPVVAVCSEGEILIAEVDVDEAGLMSPHLDADRVIRALRAGPSMPHGGDTLDVLTEADLLFAEIAAEAGETDAEVEASSQKLRDLFRSTDIESLFEARKLLPHLLGDTHRRGRVLMMMAEVERRLGEGRLALGYIDAAAHDLADRFDIAALERAAAMALAIVGAEGFVDSPIRALLHRCRARLRPVDSPFESPVLSLVPPQHRLLLDDHTRLVMLAPGDVLVTEGDPSTALIVVKSGVVSVIHEKPARRFVRCCSAGSLLGESSVLVEDDPRCTATLRVEHVAEVWRIDGKAVRAVMRDVPALREKMLETRAVHGLDSFFSAHASVGQLDAEVRNEMLKCVQRIRSFDERAVVIRAGEPPLAACLVARGHISLHEGREIDGTPVDSLGADKFVGVRDVLHHIPPARTAVAEKGATIVFFGGEELRALAERSPEQAVAVLERLG